MRVQANVSRISVSEWAVSLQKFDRCGLGERDRCILPIMRFSIHAFACGLPHNFVQVLVLRQRTPVDPQLCSYLRGRLP
jgi:hypothetical protein